MATGVDEYFEGAVITGVIAVAFSMVVFRMSLWQALAPGFLAAAVWIVVTHLKERQ